MKSLVIALFAALFGAEVCALNCYQCLSYMTSGEGLNLNETKAGFTSCNGKPEIVDCSSTGGCTWAHSDFQFHVPGSGRVSASVTVRTCGSAALDSCLNDTEVQEALVDQRDSFQPLLPSGSTFISSSGGVCTCSSPNLCNSSPVWKDSFVVLLLSLFFSYVATKW